MTISVDATILTISKLGNKPDNWDGNGSVKPIDATINHAILLVQQMYNMANSSWMNPHVSSSEDGEVTFEWWNGAHKLTIYINSKQAEFIKVWGSDTEMEMSNGTLAVSQFQDLWSWLNS